MKKIFMVVLLILVSCGEQKKELRILMWSDSIPIEVYREFEEETGIRIIEDAISSNEEIYAKVKTSGGGYDIVTPSLDYANIMIREGLVRSIDITQVPNFTNIDPNVVADISEIDPKQEYIVPFAFGVTAIAYNTKKVSEPVKGFEIFSNPKYQGKMMLLNDMREVMGSALLSLGYSTGETNEQAMKEVEKLLREWKANILRFDADAYHIAFANGEIDIVHGYPDTLVQVLTEEQKQNTKFIVPSSSAMMAIDSFLVLKNSSNQQNAMKFMNFIHRPDIYARIMDYWEGLSINVPARKLMTTTSPIDYEELTNATMLLDIGEEALTIQSRVWENVQAQ